MNKEEDFFEVVFVRVPKGHKAETNEDIVKTLKRYAPQSTVMHMRGSARDVQSQLVRLIEDIEIERGVKSPSRLSRWGLPLR